MSTAMTYADVVEGVRAAIAAYALALDDGRADDVVATFCADGVAEIPGSGTIEGQDALRKVYSGFTPRAPQRHVVVNTLVTDWSQHEANALSDLVFLQKGEAGWSVQLVGRYDDQLRYVEGHWRFQRRAMKFVN
jgi:SnoaL-like domain